MGFVWWTIIKIVAKTDFPLSLQGIMWGLLSESDCSCFVSEFFFVSDKRNISYHLQVLDDIKLGEDDKIVFYNGDSPHEEELIILCNTCPKNHVISSTGKHLSIHMMIEKPEEAMFRFRYKQGKHMVQSP